MALIAASTFTAVFLLVMAVSWSTVQGRRRVNTRLAALQRAGVFGTPTGHQASSEPEKKNFVTAILERMSANKKKNPNTGWYTKLEGALRRAEIDVPANEFALRWILVVLLLAIVGFLVKGIAISLIVVVLAAFGTLFYIRIRIQRKLVKFEEGLSDMLSMVVNSLRAGHSFIQSIQVVSEDMHGPVQEEFTQILAEMQIGVALEEALSRSNQRIGSEDFNLIVTAIIIQRQVGGNLAEVLERIGETIRERVRLKREVKALTAQGRMSGYIFMILPIGLGLFIYLIDTSYMSALFTTPIGWAMVIFSVVGQIIGFIAIRKIVQIDA